MLSGIRRSEVTTISTDAVGAESQNQHNKLTFAGRSLTRNHRMSSRFPTEVCAKTLVTFLNEALVIEDGDGVDHEQDGFDERPEHAQNITKQRRRSSQRSQCLFEIHTQSQFNVLSSRAHVIDVSVVETLSDLVEKLLVLEWIFSALLA